MNISLNSIIRQGLFLLILFFFLGIPLYFENILGLGVSASKWIILFFLLSFLLVLVDGGALSRIFNNVFFVFYLFLFLLVFVYFVLSGGGDVEFEEFKKYFFRFVFVLAVSLCFSSGFFSRSDFEKLMLFSVLVLSLLYVLEMIYPFLFVPLQHDSANPGRSAAFYVDSNQAGGALVLALLFSIRRVVFKYRVYVVALAGLGIFFTFSRSSILFYMIMVFLFFFFGLIERRVLLVFSAILVLLVAFSFTDLIFLLEEALDVGEKNNLRTIMTRIEWFFQPSNLDDSGSERVMIAKLAFEEISNSPLLGNGLSSSRNLGLDVSTHNMFLYLWVEFGIFAFLLYFVFIFCIFVFLIRVDIYYSLFFSLFIFYWSFFSHNVFDEFQVLISLCFVGFIMSGQKKMRF